MNAVQKICPKCRKPVIVEAKFCRSCGHRFRTAFKGTPVSFSSVPHPPDVKPVIPFPAIQAVAEETKPLLPVRITLLPTLSSEFEERLFVWYHQRRRLITGVTALFFAAVCTGAFLYLRYSSVSAQAGLPAAPIFTDAASLDSAYRADAAAADKIYKGKILELDCAVKMTGFEDGRGRANRPFVTVSGSSASTSLMCRFGPEAQQAVAALKEGQNVQIIGVCRGLSAGQVTLGKCTVHKQSPFAFIPSGTLSY